MQTLINAGVKVSQRTLLKQAPWIDDVEAEKEKIKKKTEESMEMYGDAFMQPYEGNSDDSEGMNENKDDK